MSDKQLVNRVIWLLNIAVGHVIGRTRLARLVGVSLLVSACSFAPIELGVRNCPCVHGWTCDEITNTCLPHILDSEHSEDMGIPESGVVAVLDANLTDGSSLDDVLVDGSPDDTVADATIDAVDVSVDTTVADTTVDTTSSPPCQDAGSLLCSDFEDGILRYDVLSSLNDLVEISSERAHRGSKSLKLTSALSSRATRLELDDVFPDDSEDQWVRAWYYLPAGDIELSIMTVAGEVGQYSVYTEGAIFSSLGSHNVTPEVDERLGIIPQDKWFCLEMHTKPGGPNTVEVYLNANYVAAARAPLPSPMTDVQLGITYRNPTVNNLSIWIDDIVLSTARVGCGIPAP